MFFSDRKGHSSSTSYDNDEDYHGKQVLGEAQNIFEIKANSLTAKVRNSDIRFRGLQNYIFEHLTYRMRFLSLRHADNFLEVERCIFLFIVCLVTPGDQLWKCRTRSLVKSVHRLVQFGVKGQWQGPRFLFNS